VLNNVYDSLKKYNKGSILKKGVSMYFANYFDLKEERQRFYKYFETIDQDRDGQLSFEELVKAYSFKVC
jgi:Ca2+-binding EF-hand superfamily protein